MNIMEKLDVLIQTKLSKSFSDEDKEKLNLIIELLKEEGCFFKMPKKTALGILKFLEVKEDEIESFYSELTSPEQFLLSMPMVRVSNER